MRKLFLLVASFAFLGGIFFSVPDTDAKTFPEPKVTCTENDKTTGQCVPGPEERYQFGAGDYCRQDGDQSARTALSHIQYQKLYGELDGTQRSKVDTLLLSATEARSLVGLVPCGRSCDDPTTSINEAERCNFCHFFFLFSNITKWLMIVIVPLIALSFILIGGFMFMMSRGNPSQVQKGKDMIIWTLAGYAIIFVGWMVLNSLLSGIGVMKWTGLTGETGEFEVHHSDGRLRDDDRSGDKAWEEDDWNGFIIEINHPNFSEPQIRRIIDTTSNTIFIDSPLVPYTQENLKLQYKIGGWWQFSCGIE